MKTILELAGDLAAGKTTARALLEDCFEAIESGSEGKTAYIAIDHDKARATADSIDALRKANAHPSPFAGIPMAVKDLYGVRGEVSAAGSTALADRPPESEDATTIARCRAAGFVFVGRTNMTEFAYSGLGLNPHHGTPKSPWDREKGRIPGGSSSGSAVAIADGMAAIALGTDTGGSCRIPAAFNGITGYKPTASRVPLDGIVPLAFSLDSAGPLGRSVTCCALTDAILAGEIPAPPVARAPGTLRLAFPQTLVLDGMDDIVANTFDRAIGLLRDAGVTVDEIPFDALGRLPEINAKGGFAAAEAYAWHKDLIAEKGGMYDQRVAARIRKGSEQTAADYITLIEERAAMTAEAAEITAPYDALIMPTVAIVAPAIAEVDNDGDYLPKNMMTLRNTSIGNFLDRCSISLPCHRPGDAPVGFMLTGENGGDAELFDVALTIEAILSEA